MAEDRRRLSGSGAVQRAERRVTFLIWGFRVLTSLLTFGGLMLVFAIHPDGTPLRYVLTTAAFMTPLSLGLVMAAITRSMHVELERKLRGQLAARSVQLQDLAMRDELTQLFNRRYFYERLQRELDEAHVLGHALGVVLLDVDGLKAINDTFGHKVGDEVLAATGCMLAEHTRGCDIPARVGGDEFAVLMLDADKRGVSTAVKRLQDALEGATVYEMGEMSLKLRLSWGAAGYPWAGTHVDDIMRVADSKLYAMKATHRRQLAGVDNPVEV